VRNLIAVVSFMVSVMGGLVTMFNKNRDKQTMGAIVGVAFLLSFFLNISRQATLVLQAACLIAFLLAVVGGVVTTFSNQEDRRVGAIVTGMVALGTSLLILFLYLNIS
jgi:hypothetical protein